MRPPYAYCMLDGATDAVQYHAAAQAGKGHTYHKEAFEYLGDGVIWSIRGYKYRGTQRLSFYRLKPNRPRWAI